MDPEHRPFQRRTVLKTIGAGAVSSVTLSGAVAAHRGGVSRELAEVRSATAEYNNPANAEADGYEGEDQAVCGMGYHYVNFDLVMDGRPEKLRPEGMVYGETSNGNRILGAVEYIVPKAAPYETEPHQGCSTMPTPNGISSTLVTRRFHFYGRSTPGCTPTTRTACSIIRIRESSSIPKTVVPTNEQ